jgi:murein DD-endopeptidase MepM/ murein hydrolase activator NlpD
VQKLFDFSKPKWMQPAGMGDLRKTEAQAPAAGGKRKTKDDFVEVFTSFQQFHVFDSYSSIILNSVRASGRDIVTNAAAIYTLGRGTAVLGPVMMADWTIRSELQKTDVVDSGTVQNIIGPDGLYAFFGYNPGEARAKTFAKSHIVSKMRDMYQDELIVLGTPALKPYDAFYLSDVYTGMYGLAEVGRVVHHLTADTGFVSTVKPDLCVRAKEAGELWNQPLVRLLTLGAYTTLQVAKLLVARRVAESAYLGARNANLLNRLPAMGKLAYEKLRVFVQTEGLGNKIAKIRSVLAGARARTLLSPASFNPLILAIDLLILGVIDKAIKGIADWFANRNTVVIYPLFFKDRPFVAGVAGAQNLIAWAGGGQSLPPPVVQGAPGQQVLPNGMFLAWPSIRDGVITGHFGERRTSPYPHTHTGLDIAFSPEDAPIQAVQKGRVSFAGGRGGYGNLVIIDHGSGIETYYAHLSAIKVATGQEVLPGNVIGSQGSTGQSTGPHLHFELRINGQPVNPLPYLPSPGGR